MNMKYLYICIIFLVSVFIIFKWKDLKKWYEYKTYEENCIIQLEKFGEQTLLAKESPEILNNYDFKKMIEANSSKKLDYTKTSKKICSCKSKKLNQIKANIFFSKLLIDQQFLKYEKEIHWFCFKKFTK